MFFEFLYLVAAHLMFESCSEEMMDTNNWVDKAVMADRFMKEIGLPSAMKFLLELI